MILSETKDPANAELIKKLKPVWGVDADGEVKIQQIGRAWSLVYAGKPWNVDSILCALLYRSKRWKRAPGVTFI